MISVVKKEIVGEYECIYYSNGAKVKKRIHGSEAYQEKHQPMETEQIMQGFTDSELRDLEIQQNQELLAKQMTDIEVALLGGDR